MGAPLDIVEAPLATDLAAMLTLVILEAVRRPGPGTSAGVENSRRNDCQRALADLPYEKSG